MGTTVIFFVKNKKKYKKIKKISKLQGNKFRCRVQIMDMPYAIFILGPQSPTY